ncbi:glycosyltransferase family 2 protein [Buttiauxella sp. S19-1]|uniref:glycosyltransferase family 2 protein n=1 Tax=Buttiauxella sp. S19-1 TaxID=941430 RepID=UPI001EDC0B30|nr:glycosyltransferase family A protein [Buttiauxella sp. S19-1]
MSFCVIIPTYNGGELFNKCLQAIAEQDIQPDKILIIDSSSSDNTVDIAGEYTRHIHIIPAEQFNHGGTRNKAAQLVSEFDFLVFLTQDAILNSPKELGNIISFFGADEDISAVCGRQLPHHDANPLAQHARYFNYPNQSKIKTRKDISVMGVKAAFMSNSFSAYRTIDLLSIGGFPLDTILAEDMYVAAKFLLNGKKVGYCAEARVRHSHNYSFLQEFKRYFDTGVFHSTEHWIQNDFGRLSGEGKRFVISEFKYLLKHNPVWIPVALLYTGAKFLGFKIGSHWQALPKTWLPRLSMYKNYWHQR